MTAQTNELSVGARFAVEHWGDAWLFEIVGETPKRWHVAAAQAGKSYNPAHGNGDKRYFDKSERRLIPVVSDAHFDAIKVAITRRIERETAAKKLYSDECDAARAEYEAAILPTEGA